LSGSPWTSKGERTGGMKNNGDKIRVLLADDHTIFREGLRSLLEAEQDVAIVGEAATGHSTIELAARSKPDIIVMDIGMPDGSGIDATIGILKFLPSCSVIILSMYDDRTHVRLAIDAGVRGYLIKQTAAVDLIKAIHEVAGGNVFFSPAVSAILLESGKADSPKKNHHGLTGREEEILKLVAMGKTTPEIGDRLCISSKTVEKHRQQMMDKLGIHDIAGLTRFAITAGLIRNT
jgi:DNA-binding NarL/FixJ family response regulator